MYTFFFSLFDNAPTVWFLDHVAGISVGDDTQESKDNIKSELDEYIPPPGSSPPQDNNVMAHGNSLTSKLDPSGPLDFDKPLWSVFYIVWMLVTNWDYGKSIDVFIWTEPLLFSAFKSYIGMMTCHMRI